MRDWKKGETRSRRAQQNGVSGKYTPRDEEG
jgi:hypothetical protein